MKRHELEHILRAAGAIAQESRFVIIGSQSILGSRSNPPEELVVSQEADIYPLDCPAKSDLIDGTIGEMSPFHEQFGYFAHGIGPETAVLPKNWMERATRINNENTRGVEGICPGPEDLAISKLVAGRDKDLQFVGSLLKYGLASNRDIRLLLTELDREMAALVDNRLTRILRDLHS